MNENMSEGAMIALIVFGSIMIGVGSSIESKLKSGLIAFGCCLIAMTLCLRR